MSRGQPIKSPVSVLTLDIATWGQLVWYHQAGMYKLSMLLVTHIHSLLLFLNCHTQAFLRHLTCVATPLLSVHLHIETHCHCFLLTSSYFYTVGLTCVATPLMSHTCWGHTTHLCSLWLGLQMVFGPKMKELGLQLTTSAAMPDIVRLTRDAYVWCYERISCTIIMCLKECVWHLIIKIN
jgi:hypothetical protein